MNKNKRTVPLALAGLVALALGAPAFAHPVTYNVTLSGAKESPANASPGTGTAIIVFDDDAFSMSIDVSFSGLTGTTTASHIHCCTSVPGAGTAGVATQVPTFAGFPLGVTSGTYSHSFDLTQALSWNPAYISAHGNSIADAFAALSTGIHDGTAYLNIHTTTFGGGEIRGFLEPAPVPLPAAAWLLLSGLGVVGGFARRRLQASAG